MATAYRHTNRKGQTYYLHERKTKAGKIRYVFAREVGAGALADLPAGYEVQESVNGVVSLSKTKPEIVTDLEKQAVRSVMAKLSLGNYRVEVRGETVTIFESRRRADDLIEAFGGLSPFSLSAAKAAEWAAKGSFDPVLRFVLDDERTRTFHVEADSQPQPAGPRPGSAAGGA